VDFPFNVLQFKILVWKQTTEHKNMFQYVVFWVVTAYCDVLHYNIATHDFNLHCCENLMFMSLHQNEG